VLPRPPLPAAPCAAAPGGDVAPGFSFDAVLGAGFDAGVGFEAETFFDPAAGFDARADVDGAGCFDLNAGFDAGVGFGLDGNFEPPALWKLGFHPEGALPVVLVGFELAAGLEPVAARGGVAGRLTAGVFCFCACAKPSAIARIAAAIHKRAILPIGRMEFIAALPPDRAVSQGNSRHSANAIRKNCATAQGESVSQSVRLNKFLSGIGAGADRPTTDGKRRGRRRWWPWDRRGIRGRRRECCAICWRIRRRDSSSDARWKKL
jgi:hypothetical protein